MSLKELKEFYPWPKKRPRVKKDDFGWFGSVHREVLGKVLDDRTELIVEIGSWMGKSTRWFCETCPNAHVIAIDTWLGSIEHHTADEGRKLIPKLYDTFITNCWEYKDQITPIRACSSVGLQMIDFLKLEPDVVFIDGSHEYLDVLRDFDFAYQLFPGATIVGDDIHDSEVERAVLEVANRHDIGIMSAIKEQGGGHRYGCWWTYEKPEANSILISNNSKKEKE